jgi:hypothetical protein
VAKNTDALLYERLYTIKRESLHVSISQKCTLIKIAMPAEYFVQNSIINRPRGQHFYSKVTGRIVFYAVLLIIVTAGLFQAADYLLYRLA